MFRDGYYWEDKELEEIEVKALLLERIRQDERKIERAISLMENKSSVTNLQKTYLPDSVQAFCLWRTGPGALRSMRS